jgi:hypothetical protein
MGRNLLIAASLGAFLLAASPVAFAGVSADIAAKNALMKAGAKVWAGYLKAYAKNIKKPNVAKLAADISKVQSKFSKSEAKIQGKYPCPPFCFQVRPPGDCSNCPPVCPPPCSMEPCPPFCPGHPYEAFWPLSGSPSGAFLDAASAMLD